MSEPFETSVRVFPVATGTAANGLSLAAACVTAGLREIPGAQLAAGVQANEVFIEMPAPVLDRLRDAGVLFARRGGELARFVCRWDNTPA